MSKFKFRETLLASTMIAGMSFANPAFAQDANDPAGTTPPPGSTGAPAPSDEDTPTDGVQPAAGQDAAEETGTGDIVVTGTLIKNPNLVSSSPVTVVGQEELQLRQTNVAEEILRDLPGVAPSIGSAVNNGNGGSSFADLRGLGNFRNLVLLDGARIVPSNFIGRVDLNNIPLALVERVDTLTGGAATTYGADAVSGVINFITRSDFAGMELQASNQITEQGDGHIFRSDLTLGANFDDGRGNAVLSVGYQEADPVYQGARTFSRNNYTSTAGNVGGSGTTVPGRFTRPGLPGFNTIVPSSGTLRPYVGSTDAFNFNPFNIFQTPFKRYNIFGSAHYEVTDGVEVYTRGMFSKNVVETIVAPSGIFSQLALIPVSSPFLPAAARAQFCATNDFNFQLAGVQSLTPEQCARAALATQPGQDVNGDGVSDFQAFQTTIGRRFVEAGPRVSTFTTQFFDYRAGVRIGLTDSIGLDISGAYGESENEQAQEGYVSISRLRTALFSTSSTTCNLGPSPTVPNPTNPLLPPLAGSGSGTQGCVPVNIFGPAGSISPEAVDFVTAEAFNAQQASLAQARALLSGDFGASAPWAEDPIGFALGAEYRNYQASQTADQLSQTAGELGGAGGAVLPFEGGYEVKELYAEVIAPLVQNRPFFESLTLEAGIRYSDYKIDAAGSPGFSTTTYKGAATWEPFDGLKFRGNYQRAVRAPNIGELFAPQNTGLTTLATDPCRTTATYQGPATNANLRAVCLAQGAPVGTIGGINNPTAAQANATTAGSLALRPEKADSYTVGLVFQPRFVPGLSLTIDYYKIEIKRAITQPSPGDLINGCFGGSNAEGVTAASATNPICGLFRRNPVTGGLDGDPATTQGLIFPASNSGRILTDGIDFGANYRRDLGFAKLNLSFQGNWTNRSEFESIVPGSVLPPGVPGAGGLLPASGTRECIGLYGSNCGSPGSAGPSSAPGSIQPEWSWNARSTFSFGDIDLSLLWRHISGVDAEPGAGCFEGPLTGGVLNGRQVNTCSIKAYDWFDLSLRFNVSENLDLTFTAMNIFDKQPPIVGSTIGTTSFNSGNTYPSTYDSLGRRFAIGGRLKF